MTDFNVVHIDVTGYTAAINDIAGSVDLLINDDNVHLQRLNLTVGESKNYIGVAVISSFTYVDTATTFSGEVIYTEVVGRAGDPNANTEADNREAAIRAALSSNTLNERQGIPVDAYVFALSNIAR